MQKGLILIMCVLVLLSYSSARIRQVWKCTDGKCTCVDDDTEATTTTTKRPGFACFRHTTAPTPTTPGPAPPSNVTTAPPLPSGPTTPQSNNGGAGVTTTKPPPVVPAAKPPPPPPPPSTPAPHKATLCPPEPCWTYYAHGTSAGSVTFPTQYQMTLSNFKYDGNGGQFVYWMMGIRQKSFTFPLKPCENYQDEIMLRDSEKGCGPIPQFTGKDITLLIPNETDYPIGTKMKIKDWDDVDWVGLYHLKAGYLLGYVKIPQGIKPSGTYDHSEKLEGSCEIKRIELFTNNPKINKSDDFVTCDATNTIAHTAKGGTVEYVP